MTNGLEPTSDFQPGGFTPSTPPQGGRFRSNVVLFVVLGVLVVAVLTVGFLLLRKRGVIGMGDGVRPAGGVVTPPSGTKPLDSYIPAPPWKEGDPEFIDEDSGGVEPAPNTQGEI